MAVKKARKKASSNPAPKRSGMGVKTKAKRAVRAVLAGAAAGAIVGAVRGAAQAGSKAMGLRNPAAGSEGQTGQSVRPAGKTAGKTARKRTSTGGATARRRSR